MALSLRRCAAILPIAGALLAVGVAGASSVALPSAAHAQAAPGHFRGHPGPARGYYYGHGYYGHGRVWYGGYGRGWYGPGWRGYGYWGWPLAYSYLPFYYPQYYYPAYVMPTAVYAMPPAPPPPAMAPQPRHFTVYFDFDRYDLTPEARQVIDTAVAAARSGGPARIEVIGNTDLAGTNRYNLVLSRHRADTVRNYMIAHGVDAAAIEVQALGKTVPAVPTADGVREPRNRRVEIVIVPFNRRPPATSMARPPMAPANATMPPPVGAPTNLVNQ